MAGIDAQPIPLVRDLCSLDPKSRHVDPPEVDLILPASTIILRTPHANPERRLVDEFRTVDRRTPGLAAFGIGGRQENSSQSFDRRAGRNIFGGEGPGDGCRSRI